MIKEVQSIQPPTVGNIIRYFCAACGHHCANHCKSISITESGNEIHSHFCRGLGGSSDKCDCRCFCPTFESSTKQGDNPIFCVNCGLKYTDHKDVKTKIATRLKYSDVDRHVLIGDVAYRVYPAGLLTCCLLAVYTFMKNDPLALADQINDGTIIKCPGCENGHIQATNDPDFIHGPTWTWTKKPEGGSNVSM